MHTRKQFRYLVGEGRRLGKEVIDRCNLTVLSEPGQEDLAAFLADNKVHFSRFPLDLTRRWCSKVRFYYTCMV